LPKKASLGKVVAVLPVYVGRSESGSGSRAEGLSSFTSKAAVEKTATTVCMSQNLASSEGLLLLVHYSANS
jgi:hypothetical protein